MNRKKKKMTKRKPSNPKKKGNSKKQMIHDAPTLVMSNEILNIIRETTLNAGQFETGGLFMGEKSLNGGPYTITLRKATGPGQRANFSEHHFIPDREHYQEQMRNELYLNGLVYVGEWHKHPGQFDEPSMLDLQTMKEITSDDMTKDVITAIAIVDNIPGAGKVVKVKFYYYKRGMVNFIPIDAHVVSLPALRSRPKMVKKAYLEIEHVLDLMKKPGTPMRIDGRLNENGSAAFLPSNDSHDSVSARLILNQNDEHEISLNEMHEDLLILVSMKGKEPIVSCWQTDHHEGGLIEVEIELLDIEKNIYNRLGGLNVSSRLEGKNVMMVGLGSVGSTAAIQLAKSGVTDFTLIDPDVVKMHNVIRHACGLNDIGRYKVDAVAERLRDINPSIRIHEMVQDCVDAYDDNEMMFNEADIFIVSTDTADSRSFINHLSVELNKPSVHVSLHDRARTGSIYRIIPNVTGCKHCIGNGIWGSEKEPGTLDYSDAQHERDVVFQPGLDTDISLVTMIGVRMSIDTLLNPDSEVAPTLGSNFIHWNGYPQDGRSMLLKTDGIGIPKDDNCLVCGDIRTMESPMSEEHVDLLTTLNGQRT